MQALHAWKIRKGHCVKQIDLVVTKYARFTHAEHTEGTKHASFTRVGNAEGTLCKNKRLGRGYVSMIAVVTLVAPKKMPPQKVHIT